MNAPAHTVVLPAGSPVLNPRAARALLRLLCGVAERRAQSSAMREAA
jgi:hypothetical protein